VAADSPAVAAGAVDQAQARCDAGDTPACARLGHDLLTGRGTPKDPGRALPLLERACTAGDADACGNAGVIFAAGMGRAKDPSMAVARFERACQLSEKACFNLAQVYDKGQGVPKEPAKAAELYRRCCDGGAAPCCTNLGVRTLKGVGVAANTPAAIRLFLEGCRGHDAVACQDLGQLCDSEPKATYEVLDRAAEGGDTVAALLLGWFLQEGRGGRKDVARARKLFDAACKGGHEEGCKELEQLGGAPKP
jgi:TPR repeat protein